MEDRIEDLETRLAFQEHMLEQLNQAVTSQQRQLDDLLLVPMHPDRL